MENFVHHRTFIGQANGPATSEGLPRVAAFHSAASSSRVASSGLPGRQSIRSALSLAALVGRGKISPCRPVSNLVSSRVLSSRTRTTPSPLVPVFPSDRFLSHSNSVVRACRKVSSIQRNQIVLRAKRFLRMSTVPVWDDSYICRQAFHRRRQRCTSIGVRRSPGRSPRLDSRESFAHGSRSVQPGKTPSPRAVLSFSFRPLSIAGVSNSNFPLRGALTGGSAPLSEVNFNGRRSSVQFDELPGAPPSWGRSPAIDRGNPVSGSNSSCHAANATSLFAQKNSSSSRCTTTICQSPYPSFNPIVATCSPDLLKIAL